MYIFITDIIHQTQFLVIKKVRKEFSIVLSVTEFLLSRSQRAIYYGHLDGRKQQTEKARGVFRN